MYCLDNCIYCERPIYQDDEMVCVKGFFHAHLECSEREDPEGLDCDDFEEE